MYNFSSLVIDTLCDQNEGKNVAVAWLYCDFLGAMEEITVNILGALVKQLVRVLGTVPAAIYGAFNKAKRDGRGLRVPDAIRHLRATLDLFERTFICVDALDEFPDKILPELLSSLGAISQELPGVRLFITGRPHVQSVVEKYFPNRAQVIPISPNSGDIREYLTKALREDLNSGAMDCALEAEIMERIEEISGVYAMAISISKAQSDR